MQNDTNKHIHVKLPELDGRTADKGGQPRKEEAFSGGNASMEVVLPAGASLLTLKDRCKTYLGAQVGPEVWKDIDDKFRHFWLDGEFLPYYRAAKAENRLEHVAKTSFATLTFARDVYIIRTPRGTGEWVLDPEISVREVLDYLEAEHKIEAVCCYDVFDYKGHLLNLANSLYSQNALPYNGLTPRSDARLEVKLKADHRRLAALLLLIFALVGFGAGFLIRRYGT